MKKILALILFIVLLAIGWIYIDSQDDDSVEESVEEFSQVVDTVENQTPNLVEEDPQNYGGALLPDDVHVNQVFKTVGVGSGEYALIVRSNINIPVTTPAEFPALTSGVLQNAGDKWEWILQIEDITSSQDPKNNVLDVYEENGSLQLLVIDALGAGSGEGVAKIFSGADNGASFTLSQCGYYSSAAGISEGFDPADLEAYPLTRSECQNAEVIVK